MGALEMDNDQTNGSTWAKEVELMELETSNQ